MDIKVNKEKIKLLSDQMLYQLKHNSWIPMSEGFSNKNFAFRNGSDHWVVRIIFSEYNTSNDININEFISPLKFWYLRKFYVNKTLENYEKYKRDAELDGVSDKFFANKKDLLRDTKLDKLIKK